MKGFATLIFPILITLPLHPALMVYKVSYPSLSYIITLPNDIKHKIRVVKYPSLLAATLLVVPFDGGNV